MPLCLRPHSINSYALSKVWFKANCIDLRLTDIKAIKAINTKVKTWLYTDQFEKPEELVLHRPVSHGGLNMHHVKNKAQATLIRAFMETASNPSFIRSPYHQALFEHYVIGESAMPVPRLPPYYNKDFFKTIKNIHETAPLDPATMSVKQWYLALMDDTFSDSKDTQSSPTPWPQPYLM